MSSCALMQQRMRVLHRAVHAWGGNSPRPRGSILDEVRALGEDLGGDAAGSKRQLVRGREPVRGRRRQGGSDHRRRTDRRLREVLRPGVQKACTAEGGTEPFSCRLLHDAVAGVVEMRVVSSPHPKDFPTRSCVSRRPNVAKHAHFPRRRSGSVLERMRRGYTGGVPGSGGTRSEDPPGRSAVPATVSGFCGETRRSTRTR